MADKKTTLITRITKQYATFLTEYLLHNNNVLHSIKRRTLLINANRIYNLFEDSKHHYDT